MNLGSTGSNGESYAAEYLQNKGYEIITRNFSSRFGEIDIAIVAEYLHWQITLRSDGFE